MDNETNTNVPESEPLAETQTEEIPAPEEVAEEEREPIKTVNTFWERLDDVLDHLESQPQQLHPREAFKSALNQPKQLFVCSTQDTTRAINGILKGTYVEKTIQTETFFDSFRVSFADRSLLNVKSIQLYSASIPQAQCNITDNEIYFWFYQLTTLAQDSTGAWSSAVSYTISEIVEYGGRYYGCYNAVGPSATTPAADTAHWYDAGSVTDPTKGEQINWLLLDPSIRANSLFYFNLYPTYDLPTENVNISNFGWNRTFTSYADLLQEVNRAAGYNATGHGLGRDELYFEFNEQFNKFVVYPQVEGAFYYFFPAFSDTVYQQANINFPLNLNLRLGFTQQVDIPTISSNPWTSGAFGNLDTAIFGHTGGEGVGEWLMADSYANLNYTNRCNIFADFCRTSSFDTYTGGELLASVPMNAGNLGITLYQAKFPNRLDNVPPEIYDMFFYFETDNKIPYLFPKSATISLELALEYF